MTVDRLAPDEPLSPELVLVLPPELRADALARLPLPVWPETGPYLAVTPPPPHLREPLSQTLATVLVARVAQLIVIFVSVTLLILTLAAVANAVR